MNDLKKTMIKHKPKIIAELKKLERLNWAKDSRIAHTVFPYVLIEAINLLKNSEIIDNPIDYAATGEDAKNLVNEMATEC